MFDITLCAYNASEVNPLCSELSVVDHAMHSHNCCMLLADTFVGRRRYTQHSNSDTQPWVCGVQWVECTVSCRKDN
jgi:hypothetical protein